MKQKWYAALALVLCAACLCAGAWAQSVAGIELIGVHTAANEAKLQLGVKVVDTEGAVMPAQLENLMVQASEDHVRLSPAPLSRVQQGHIIVVDTSCYYYDSGKIKDQDVRDILAAYLSGVPLEDRVMFLMAGEGQPSSTGYMSALEAQAYASLVSLADKNHEASCIDEGIHMAFEAAITPSAGAPLFNSIFIVADADRESNETDGRTLGRVEALSSFSGKQPEVLLAVPYRAQYLKNTSTSERNGLTESLDTYRAFCQSVGGVYAEIPQNDSGVDLAPLQTALDTWMGAALYFELDYSRLSGHVAANAGTQSIPLVLVYDDGREQAQLTLAAEINTNLIAAPAAPVTPIPVTKPPVTTPPVTPEPVTPTPHVAAVETEAVTPTPEPTPTASPTPTPKPGLMDMKISIGSLTLKLWVLAAAGIGVSILVVVIVVICAAGKRRRREAYIGEHSPSPSFQQLGMEEMIEEPIVQIVTNDIQSVEATLPKNYGETESIADVEQTLPRNYDQPDEEDCEPTQQPYSTLQISFDVIYNGQCRSEKLEMMEDRPYLIGRRDNKLTQQVCDLVLDNNDKYISRKQAKLIWKEGKMYLLDMSTYGNTLVNDQKIPTEKENAEGVQLASGDCIKISSHTITIKWEDNPYA